MPRNSHVFDYIPDRFSISVLQRSAVAGSHPFRIGENHPMLPPNHCSSNRREFLRSALRYSALAGIAGLVASAARRSALNGAACTRARFCEACSQFSGCDKNQAETTRQAAKKIGGAS
jgi:hypothetical protein